MEQRKNKRKVRRRRISPRKITKLIVAIGFFVLLIWIFTRKSEDEPTVIARVDEPVEAEDFVDDTVFEPIVTVDPTTDFGECLEKMPEPTVKMKVNYFGNPLKIFNDSNHVHLAEAKSIGIKPLSDSRSHWKLGRHIVKVTSCKDYFVDRLTYSRPYLVPEAEMTLREIGSRFRDTIAARGGGDYRIKVTSLLRTPSTVQQLRRRNRNAVDSSTHQYATTFDISYASFIANSDTVARSVDDLKGVLSEVLKAMREEGKIYVKYERKQPCFHITARARKI